MTAVARAVRVLNPIVALSELLLGVRKPDGQVLEIDETRPLIERFHVPCPACGGHTRTIYYQGAALFAYAGFVCGHCGAKVATMPNVFTRLVELLTWPLWRPFRDRLQAPLLKWQFKALQAAREAGAKANRRIIAVRVGLLFGLLAGAFAFFQLTQSGLGGLYLWAMTGLIGWSVTVISFLVYDRLKLGTPRSS